MMNKRPLGYALYAMGAFTFGTASVLALTPQTAPTRANYATVMMSCVKACESHMPASLPPGMTPQAFCGPYCNALSLGSPGYPQTPTGQSVGSFIIPNCKLSQGAIWAWNKACTLEEAMLTQGGGVLGQALSGLLGGNTGLANQLIQQAKQSGDPCAYITSQLQAQTPSC